MQGHRCTRYCIAPIRHPRRTPVSQFGTGKIKWAVGIGGMNVKNVLSWVTVYLVFVVGIYATSEAELPLVLLGPLYAPYMVVMAIWGLIP